MTLSITHCSLCSALGIMSIGRRYGPAFGFCVGVVFFTRSLGAGALDGGAWIHCSHPDFIHQRLPTGFNQYRRFGVTYDGIWRCSVSDWRVRWLY